uniref:Putative product n=1 Tax=Xenopsylla cheopis TaxID=163159 RepID=A0A6M2DYD6_XENCH
MKLLTMRKQRFSIYPFCVISNVVLCLLLRCSLLPTVKAILVLYDHLLIWWYLYVTLCVFLYGVIREGNCKLHLKVRF